MDLRTALLGCSSGQLSRIAAVWTLDVEAGTLRRELVEAVAARIAGALEEGSVWGSLGELALQVASVLVHAGGRHELDLLGRRVRQRVGRSASDEADEIARLTDAAIASLVERGLVFRVYDAEEQRRGVYLVMPDEVLASAGRVLERHFDGPNHANDSHGDADGAVQPDRVAVVNVAADLFALASALRRESWGNASRELARRRSLTVGQIVGHLRQQPADGPGEPGRRWRFLLWLAQRAGWISRDPWPLPDDEAIGRLLADPASLPTAALAAGPVTESGPVQRGRLEPGGPERGSSRMRQADALQLLSELGDGSWWSAPGLAAWLARELDAGDGGAVSGGRSITGGRPVRSNRTAQQFERWLDGRWFWLGLVARGWDGKGWGLVAPTTALRVLTTGRPAASAPARRPCRLSDGLQLEAPADADLALLYRAEQYLAFAGTDGGMRRYRLTPPSFERGLRLGGDADELLSLLERLGQQRPSTAWVESIERWSRGSVRLRLQARLILTADRAESVADALRVGAVGDAVIETPSPHHAIVAGEHVASLLADLAQAGLPVDVEPGVRLEPGSAGRAAGLAGGVAETAWVALEVLRRLAPDVVGDQRDLQAARAKLEAVLSAAALEVLGRRAATIAAAISDRRRSHGRTQGRRRGA
jgi:hypothetical protein